MSAIDANNIGILRDLSADRGNIDSEGRDLHLICTRGLLRVLLREASTGVQAGCPEGNENSAAG